VRRSRAKRAGGHAASAAASSRTQFKKSENRPAQTGRFFCLWWSNFQFRIAQSYRESGLDFLIGMDVRNTLFENGVSLALDEFPDVLLMRTPCHPVLIAAD
jgi:hypothetical protein